ncbi:spore germination protein [Risungbinella massiliensis]|uniref:spore germination protein n=1 Tax=Risungbinella massiliensis TaxID=1329796 RepID=UPI0005CC31AF|nr:spore germination protein [Risungbinella massiliensis]
MRNFINLIEKLSKDKEQKINEQQPTKLIYKSLSKNLEIIKITLGNCSDLIVREFQLGKTNVKAAIFYLDGLVNINYIQENILKSLMADVKNVTNTDGDPDQTNIIAYLKNHILTVGETKKVFDFKLLYHSLLSGDTILLIDGQNQGLISSTREWKERGVQESSTQSVVKGSKESFTETMRTNTALVRRRIKDTHLRIDTRQIGRVTKTDVAVLYIDGIADEKVVKEVFSRLDSIDIDAILDSGYIEELIEDTTYTPFPTTYSTELPDTVAAGLLEGRVAIMVDGTPFALLVPGLFVHFFHSNEDYYQRFDISTFVRILRFIAFVMALLVPSIYIAVTTYHQEMIPTSLLISLAAQRDGVPFPALFEAMMMEFTFEVLREAGLRLPKNVGSAISIVGALVLGQAAVQAGLISAAMVIVVSLTAISSFMFPSYTMSFPVRILRFIFMGLAGFIGLLGVGLGLIALIFHLCSLRSFGVPYMAPFGPYIQEDQKDAIFRFPRGKLFSRPRLISHQNRVRIKMKH